MDLILQLEDFSWNTAYNSDYFKKYQNKKLNLIINELVDNYRKQLDSRYLLEAIEIVVLLIDRTTAIKYGLQALNKVEPICIKYFQKAYPNYSKDYKSSINRIKGSIKNIIKDDSNLNRQISTNLSRLAGQKKEYIRELINANNFIETMIIIRYWEILKSLCVSCGDYSWYRTKGPIFMKYDLPGEIRIIIKIASFITNFEGYGITTPKQYKNLMENNNEKYYNQALLYFLKTGMNLIKEEYSE